MLEPPVSRPAAGYDEALRRVRALTALDDASILPQARTTLLDCGTRAAYAVVLLHGFTNHPGQYAQLAPLVQARGANVLIPRLPGHGDRDRMTTDLASLTAEQLLAAATEALDIACGLGERVCVLGISTSALLCAYAAQYRGDVFRSVCVSPVFAMLQLPYAASRMLAGVIRLLPNMFLWWDPRLKTAQRPRTAYPRFPTHALAQALRVGDDVVAASKRAAALAKSIVTIVNRTDPAVNNEVAAQVVRNWRSMRAGGIDYRDLRSLPENHDIIDPDNPSARTEIVYPVLLDALLTS